MPIPDASPSGLDHNSGATSAELAALKPICREALAARRHSAALGKDLQPEQAHARHRHRHAAAEQADRQHRDRHRGDEEARHRGVGHHRREHQDEAEAHRAHRRPAPGHALESVEPIIIPPTAGPNSHTKPPLPRLQMLEDEHRRREHVEEETVEVQRHPERQQHEGRWRKIAR